MDAQQILREARRCKDERFSLRDAKLRTDRELRFGLDKIEVPDGYKQTSQVYHAPNAREEGRQVFALVDADPVPHIPPPSPEMQPVSTKVEQFLMAARQELESVNGSIDNKCQSAQTHDRIGWIYVGAKRRPYDGQPTPPGDDTDYEERIAFGEKNARFKREAGISAVFDYRHVPTNTVYVKGDIWNPLCIYEIKDVDADELMLEYGLNRDRDGKFSKPETTTLPSGTSEYERNTKTDQIRVVEYWDRQKCVILIENGSQGWFKGTKDSLELEKWEHNWGRVPYFARPAFENEATEEEFKFEGPLDGLYAELAEYNRLRTMMSNVAYQTGFAPLKVVTKEGGDLILDDAGMPKTFIEFKPGKAFQLAPGQDVMPMPLAPEVAILASEIASSEMRLRQFSTSQIAKGISPGADTANSALSQLTRRLLSSLKPMATAKARQWREIFKFMLQRIRDDIGETVYVYDYSGDVAKEIDLSPHEVITLALQVKVDPDTGTDKLIEEKQAAELLLQGLITEIEFHERRGKEDPEEFFLANAAARLYRAMEPQIQTQFMAALGDSQAIMQLIVASQEGGDAKAAIPGILEQMQASQNGETGVVGSGSPGLPRDMGVRSPNVQPTTAPSVPGSFDA